jgi:hypothetical protein
MFSILAMNCACICPSAFLMSANWASIAVSQGIAGVGEGGDVLLFFPISWKE